MCVLLCCVLFFCWVHLWKERAGWCELAEKRQSASLHFSRAFHFSLGHLSQTRIHAHSAPLLRSRITQNRASLPFNWKKHSWFWMKRTRVRTPDWVEEMNVVTPAYGGRWHQAYFHSHIKWQAQMQSANYFGFWDGFKCKWKCGNNYHSNSKKKERGERETHSGTLP